MLPFAPDLLVVMALVVPILGALLIALAHPLPNLRETATLTTAGTLFLIVASLTPHVLAGLRPAALDWQVVPGLAIAFKVEPLGMLFALVASSLWILNSIYSIGYMRGNNEPRQTSFYVCFAVAIGATMGIAFAGNLFTLFVFYEALTLSTYPLVTHKANGDAIRAGRIYLLILIGTSTVLLIPAIAWTWVLAGTLDFTPGGILAGKAGPLAIGLLLALFAFGIGKAALMPFHFWLPAAMVAPTPVSALLHAVAVVKAGVFTVLKVVVYIFGLETLTAGGARDWLVYASSFTIVVASLIALSRGNLKARLAYSTVSQLSYVVLGGALATTTSVIGAGMHIAMHAAGKITLFFCAGAIYVATHKTEISELDGLGRAMPFTFAAFLIGALSIIGLPPMGGTWSKWLLAAGALEAGFPFVVGVLMVSSLLNVAYLLPIVARAFFLPLRADGHGHANGLQEAPIACVVPLCVTAVLCVVLFAGANWIEDLLRLMLRTV